MNVFPLAAVCCHFNPLHYASRLANTRAFRAGMRSSGVDLVTVELAFGDDAFELEPGPEVLHIRGGDVMWQKERLLQVGGEHAVANGARALAFLDADLIFEDEDWPTRMLETLDRVPVAQCFDRVTVHYSDETFEIDSGVKRFQETGDLEGRVGYGWAMRSDVFLHAGLYQHCVVGGGDSMMFLGAVGLAAEDRAWERGILFPHDFFHTYGPASIAHYSAWARRLVAATGGLVGYAPVGISTLPHGLQANREYLGRHQMLAGFDPTAEVRCAEGGPWEWADPATPRRHAVEAYFRSREEDAG